jgi:hypothetical protein
MVDSQRVARQLNHEPHIIEEAGATFAAVYFLFNSLRFGILHWARCRRPRRCRSHTARAVAFQHPRGGLVLEAQMIFAHGAQGHVT